MIMAHREQTKRASPVVFAHTEPLTAKVNRSEALIVAKDRVGNEVVLPGLHMVYHQVTFSKSEIVPAIRQEDLRSIVFWVIQTKGHVQPAVVGIFSILSVDVRFNDLIELIDIIELMPGLPVHCRFRRWNITQIRTIFAPRRHH